LGKEIPRRYFFMNKDFDCVELKRKIQEELWLEGGETLDGLKRIIFNKNENDLYNYFKNRKEVEKQLTVA
jgi:hypothetical protein